MALILALSFLFKRQLGLYGKILDNKLGLIGLGIVLFWVLAAILATGICVGDYCTAPIVTYDELQQFSGMKNKKPGWPVRTARWIFHGQAGHDPDLCCEPRSRLSGDLAVLSVGDKGHREDRYSDVSPCCSSFR